MIDYEKLKEAHELAEKYYDSTGYTCVIELNFYYGCSDDGHKLWIKGFDENFNNIDDLIAKLKELTQPEPKYKGGDNIYSLLRRGMSGFMTGSIDKFDPDRQQYYVLFPNIGCYWMNEDDIYPTREALIQSQIDYWQSLSEDKPCEHLWVRGKCHDCGAVKICEHEPDNRYHYEFAGGHFDLDYKSNNSLNEVCKCIKCEEYY